MKSKCNYEHFVCKLRFDLYKAKNCWLNSDRVQAIINTHSIRTSILSIILCQNSRNQSIIMLAIYPLYAGKSYTATYISDDWHWLGSDCDRQHVQLCLNGFCLVPIYLYVCLREVNKFTSALWQLYLELARQLFYRYHVNCKWMPIRR